MPTIPNQAQTDGSSTFSPDAYFDAWAKGELTPPYDNNFRKFIIQSFGLSPRDDYPYKATAEVTLLQAQTYLEMGAQGGLHAWYKDVEEEKRTAPTAADIAAYTDIFRPTTQTPQALPGFASNAKKNSIRAEIAAHLQSLYQPPSGSSSPRYPNLTVPRSKSHANPYLDVWAWTNQMLTWAGPEPATAQVRFSHALLPVLYHHFGCVCPSWDALAYIAQVAGARAVLDIGSGNGYWTYLLRRFRMPGAPAARPPLEVVPIDSGVSEWRTMWIGDTLETDGVAWLGKNGGGKDAVLLLVYPSVGHEFTARTIKAYKGRTIICAGSQNTNGFTAFADETIAQWVARELPSWHKVLQIPLPSFAGKDEALFIFEKGE